MAKIKLGKVGLTNEGIWNAKKAFPVLSLVTHKGQAYISFRANAAVEPGTDESTWMLIAERGESLYQMMVREGLFTGTEAEFLQKYQDILDAAKQATQESVEQMQSVADTMQNYAEAEQGRVDAEDARVSEESERVSAEDARALEESNRVSAEDARVLEESNRVSAEDARVSEESERVNAEDARVLEESNRVSAEDARVSEESSRVSAEDARVSEESSRVSAEDARVLEESNRVSAEDARILAERQREQDYQDYKNTLDNAVELSGKAIEDINTTIQNTENKESARDTAFESAEAERQSTFEAAEAKRDDAEAARATAFTQAEALRQSTYEEAESSRTTAESGRVEAENTRVEEFATLKENAETATSNANDAAETANTAAQNADNIANGIDDRVTALEDRVGNITGYYGVERLRNSAEGEISLDPEFPTEIGRTDLVQSHPILADYKMCKVKDGKVVAVLDNTNWNKLRDGSPSNVIIDGVNVQDDGSDVMFCNTTGFYAILGGDNPDYEIHAVGYKPFTHRGVVAQWSPPYGDCPDYSVIKDGLQRSIRDNTVAGSNGAGSLGISAYNEKGYPSTSVSRFNFELYARKKNTQDHTDNKKNIPYANAFQLDRMVWSTLLFIKFKTKDLHKQSLLGGAISCNDGTISEDTWLHKTGMRTRASESGPWTYSNIVWSSSSWGGINDYKPLLKMFDMQLALSYAKENNISENETFEYDGATYQYSDVINSKSIYDDEMTAIVTKLMKTTDENTEVCLVQPIVCGKVVGWGNVYTWTSGIECVVNGEFTYDIYQTNDVSKLPTDNNSSDINEGETYDFESVLEKVGSVKIGEGYSKQDFYNSLMSEIIGGSLHTKECHYNWYTSKVNVGKRARRGVLFGLVAFCAVCALRSAFAFHSPADAGSNFGGGFRVTLSHT